MPSPMNRDSLVSTSEDPPIDEHEDDGNGPSSNNDKNDHAPIDENVNETTTTESEDTGEDPSDFKNDRSTNDTHATSSELSPGMSNECNDNEAMEKSTPSATNDCFQHAHTITSALTKQNSKQYEYIKHGSRIKALIGAAFKAVSDGFSTGNKRHVDEPEEGNEVVSKRARGMDEIHAQDLARDRMEECVNLKLKVQELQSQNQALQQENYASHQTSNQLQSKIDRTLAALQIASTSSANARAEADAAEAKANSLSKQVEEFHSLVEELRRGIEAVRGEHDEVSTAARSVESRLIQVESELSRAMKVKIEAEDERDELKARAQDAEKKACALIEQVEDYEHEIRCLKKDVVEMEELEKIRSERTNRIENELHIARGTLLDATSAAAEAESTVTSLNSVIEELRKENELLHSQINDSRDSVNKERAKQNEALTAAEKEIQKWKLKCEEEQEANRTLKMDKTSAEKQVEQMKSRMSHLERRMNDTGADSTRLDIAVPTSSATVTPKTPCLGLINSFGEKKSSVNSEPRKELTYISKLPTRESSSKSWSTYDDTSSANNYTSNSSKYFSSEKENESRSKSMSSLHEMSGFNKRKVSKPNKCFICGQDAMGMMKNCQCDKINCDKRAHLTCISRRNVEKGTSSNVLCE